MKKFRGFTLAEVLITLAIIGVVAAIAVPSVISNSQQREFKTGLKKAVSVLNSAITMNIAIEGESPYDNGNLFGYLTRHMNVIKTTISLPWWGRIEGRGGFSCSDNAAFYTADGMRFEMHWGADSLESGRPSYTYENNVALCKNTFDGSWRTDGYTPTPSCGGCGSYGLNDNPDGTTKPPCLILVDVNGDRKPTPANINATQKTDLNTNIYKSGDPKGTRLTDLFTIMITDRKAVPYGMAAQKAMYDAKK